MRPHKIHVEAGPEYPGENYLWCECKAQPSTKSLANSYMMDSRDRQALFDQGEWLLWRNGTETVENPDALTKLIAWLAEHGAFANSDSVRAVAATGVTG